ncbi:MAG TPA: 50S ribosomal protein L9 [Patescibacteria group bacterium]|nr:50S ribosomal protein L9 [Patescibacteria group bacterium]
MDILLLSDVKNFGKKGDILKVKEGFARNFLLPKKLGVIATQETKARVERQREKAHEISQAGTSRSREYARQLEGKVITLTKPKTNTGTLYAALTEQDILEAIHTQLAFNPKDIFFSSLHHLKHVGQYTIPIDCGYNEYADLVVLIT